MDTNNFQKVREIVEKTDKVVIAVGKNPSVDAMAAALSLHLGLAQSNRKSSVISATDPLVEHSSLIGIDKVRSTYEGEGGDLVVSFPYKEGEIEKVSYTIESGFLNIVVKAGQQGLNFDEQDVNFKRGGGQPLTLFVVGTQQLSDLEALFDPESLKNAAIVNIDNNPENQGFGDTVILTQKSTSVSEQVGRLLFELGIDPDIDVAQNLLNGISAGTNNFQDPNTEYSAFEMAASLMRKGAVRTTRQMPRYEDTQALQGLVQRPTAMQRPDLTRPNLTPRPQSPMQRPAPRQMPQQPAPSNFAPQAQDQDLEQKRTQIQDMLRREQQNQQQSQPNGQPKDQPTPGRKPPSDWLTPKVYKGSSNI